jgi:hypothetical protein
VGSLHWLIIVPYYFFGALSLLSALVVACRLLRLKVSINFLVMTSIITTLLALAVPLTFDWVDVDSFTGRGAAALLIGSFLFAGIDAVLKRWLSLPLDEELEAQE